jgi:hypothetical protein
MEKDELYLNMGFEILMWSKYVQLDLAVTGLHRKESCMKLITNIKSGDDIFARKNKTFEQIKFHLYYHDA